MSKNASGSRHAPLNRFVERGHDRLIPQAPFRRARRMASTVEAHRAFCRPQQPSDVAVRTLSALQPLDRHTFLPTKLGHAPPPSARTETEPCRGASRPGRCVRLDVALAQVWGLPYTRRRGRTDRGDRPRSCSYATPTTDPVDYGPMAHEIEISASGAPVIAELLDAVVQLKLPYCNRNGTSGLKTGNLLTDGLQRIAFRGGTKRPRYEIPDPAIILVRLPLALSSRLPLPPHGS